MESREIRARAAPLDTDAEKEIEASRVRDNLAWARSTANPSSFDDRIKQIVINWTEAGPFAFGMSIGMGLALSSAIVGGVLWGIVALIAAVQVK